jgi:hypothetical protein
MFTPHNESQTWLTAFLTEYREVAGIVHVERGGDLYLRAAQNIPTIIATSLTSSAAKPWPASRR